MLALTGIISDNNRYRTGMLGVSYLLDEGAGSTIDHEDEGLSRGGEGVAVEWTGAEVVVGVLEEGLDGASVGGDAEECFTVFEAVVSVGT